MHPKGHSTGFQTNQHIQCTQQPEVGFQYKQ